MNKKHHFAIRADREILDKLSYIASYNGRSSNKEIEQLIIKHISEFEKQHDKIILDNKNS